MVNIFVFLVGLSIGSFINCLVYRLNEKNGQGLISGRSECPKCGHQLRWYENIPLISFIFLKGKCRYCQKPISVHYPLVELSTGILFALTYQQIGSNSLFSILYSLFSISCFMAIFLSDFLYFTIPDEIVLPAIGISLLKILVVGHLPGRQAGWSLIIPGLLSALFFFILVLVTKGRGMGLGDVKLAGLMGFFLGYPKIVVALYLAFLTGAIVGVILIISGKKRLGEHIPFGPFLTTAAIISFFWGDLIWQKSMVLLS
jgi:leader peptidase (prepilin peptidase)/N-methyltransferase